MLGNGHHHEASVDGEDVKYTMLGEDSAVTNGYVKDSVQVEHHDSSPLKATEEKKVWRYKCARTAALTLAMVAAVRKLINYNTRFQLSIGLLLLVYTYGAWLLFYDEKLVLGI